MRARFNNFFWQRNAEILLYLVSSYALYEWNIDGMSKYEVLNVLEELIMVSNVYKADKRTDHQIARYLVTGFTGQLKGWWDHYLNASERSWSLTNLSNFLFKS